MEIKFEGFTRFFASPPSFSDMALRFRDDRRGKGDVLIIVPSYHDSYRLEKLLRYLRGQAFKRFDVAIIFARDDPFVEPAGLSLYQVNRKIDAGFAGAVYLGQLLALSEGYKYYLFTDVDRVPHAQDVLGALFEAAEESGADFVYGDNLVKGYFFPSKGFCDYANPKAVKSNCVFSLVRTSTLERTGLYALPLYIGYEDVEFEYRLRKAAKSERYIPRIIYESYSSPAKNAFLKNFGGDAMGNLYLYPTMVCMFASPQTSNHLGFVRKAKTFFTVLLTQEFASIRMPEFSLFEENARKRIFAKTGGTGARSALSISPSGKGISEDYAKYTANAPASNAARMLAACVFGSPSHTASNYSPLFDFFIHDSFHVFDESRNEALLYSWKRKASLPSRLSALFRAAAGTLFALIRAQYFELVGDKGIFNRYGVAPKKAGPSGPGAPHPRVEKGMA